jgi:hypothetical protein
MQWLGVDDVSKALIYNCTSAKLLFAGCPPTLMLQWNTAVIPVSIAFGPQQVYMYIRQHHRGERLRERGHTGICSACVLGWQEVVWVSKKTEQGRRFE